MKAKKWIAASLTVAGGCLLAAMPVSAAEVDSMNTDMSVGFGTDTQTPNPSPVLPNTASLRSVPSALSFGDNNSLSSNAQTFSLQGLGTTTRYVAVKDTRAGNNSWKVTAKASVLTDGGTSKFEGTNNFAKLSFTSTAKVYHGSGTPGVGNNITDLVGNPNDPQSGGTVTIKADGSDSKEVIKSAATGSPAGGWASELTAIKLIVPGGIAYEGAQYTGTITWSLEDTL
ncbi:WxL domain-containing protein [Vagococcus lutrae]|uniref:WxL domain-containing protein n=1 Tax=Vagococcus lutrae TaxID=81947 RepID=UPI00200E3787|nr:WxL domain-containing protein [Vagococcus lutrae]UQF22627.1 WxL domain-containing protein [Vagococcus lutrae]UQF63454.1 WxL domain-containing protein [Vagococcus lutrae]